MTTHALPIALPRTIDPPRIAGRRRGFASCTRTQDQPAVCTVRGTLPQWLAGSLLLNGPALWELPGGAYAHWFDGLAMLHRVHFAAGGVHYRSRFLDSEDARLSRQRGRPELGGFDTKVAGGLLSRIWHMFDPRRTDNGAVVLAAREGSWLALTESDRALRFDPETLATLGEARREGGGKLPLNAAHPCVDAAGRWWNVGIAFGRRCEYVLFSADAAGRRSVKARIPTKRPGYLHAFALGGGHALIWECAWRAHPLRFLFAGESYARHFDWLPDAGSRIHAVSLADGGVRSWDAPPLFVFHAVQGFARGADLVLDVCGYDEPLVDALAIERLRSGGGVPPARHTRYVLTPGRGRVATEPQPGRFELPQVHPGLAGRAPARHVWAAAAHADGAFFDRTVKLDTASGRLLETGSDDAIALEPLFVPRPGAHAEDDGVLLVPTLSNTDAATRLRVLDAATLDERAAVELPAIVPFGFHAAWRAA